MPRSASFAFVVALVLTSLSFAEAGAPAGWDKKIDKGSARFKILDKFEGAAVLDKETGLLWERSPSTSPSAWRNAYDSCLTLKAGGRLAWRLPTAPELSSLHDLTQSNPSLPPGHPFENVSTSTLYWSSSPSPSDANSALLTSFQAGDMFESVKVNAHLHWCVRGPGGE